MNIEGIKYALGGSDVSLVIGLTLTMFGLRLLSAVVYGFFDHARVPDKQKNTNLKEYNIYLQVIQCPKSYDISKEFAKIGCDILLMFIWQMMNDDDRYGDECQKNFFVLRYETNRTHCIRKEGILTKMIRLAEIFTDYIILQRHRQIPIWGEGQNGTVVNVQLGSNQKETIVENGVWSVKLPEMEAGTGYQITITAVHPKTSERACITINHVAVGEVWIASGQSNMQFLYRYDLERISDDKIVEDEELRFFDVPEVSYEGQREIGHFENYGFWRMWNGVNSEWFSAVGFYFARMLREKLKVPVGIIGCNWPGCNAVTWISPERIETEQQLRKVVEEYKENLKTIDMDAYIRATDYMTAKDPDIEQRVVDLFMMGVKSSEIEANRKDIPTEEEKKFFMLSMQVGPRSYRRPSGLYEMMLKKILPCEISGVLWYQGEEDEVARSEFYDISLRGVIDTFRDRWDNLPFLIVQLPPYEGNAIALARKYPVVRRMQEKVSKMVPNVWCACATDAGDRNNIHPRRKRPVGERLGLLALRHVYSVDVEADSPQFVSAEKEGEMIVLHFENVADGLCTHGKGETGIELYAEGYRLKPDIEVGKDTVILMDESISSITTDIMVKYAMDNFFEVNLFNSAGLPVFPFETEI